MSLRDVLVFLDRSTHCASRLDFAARLSQAHGAGLIGLRVVVHPRIPQAILADIPEAALQMQRDARDADGRRLQAAFGAACEAHSLRCEWWQEDSHDGGIDAVCRAARHANLTVIGPSDGDEELASDDLLHQLVLSSGRPVLVVPDAAPAGPIGRRVLVAWNGTREASRALADALPLLAKAEQVTILAVLDDHDAGDPGLGEVCRHLLRNGITAESKVVHSHAHDGGAALVAQAGAMSADLLVMGAYGRSRLREVVLGGATRHVLRHLPIPVLMAH